MTKQPLISIIVPAHNVEQFIDETLETIFQQTMDFQQLELILVNDGSTDRSGSIIDSYAARYDNVKAIHLSEASGAAGKPRNFGIEAATGEFLLFVDPDDIFELTACETLYEIATRHNSDIVVGTFSSFSDTFENDQLFQSFDTAIVINSNVEQHPFFLQIPNNLGAKLYRTSFVKAHHIDFPIAVASQDAYFTTKAYLLSNNISFIPNKIFKYRIRTDAQNPSITQNRSLKYFRDFSYIRHLLIDLYKEFPRLNYFDIRYKNDLRWLFYQLEHVNNISAQEKIMILQEISWFVQLATDEMDIAHVLPWHRFAFFTKIRNHEYEQAITYMNNETHDLFKNI